MRFHALRECPVAVAVENIFCISQCTATTFFRCGGPVQKHIRRISSGFCSPKLFVSVDFWRSYSKNKNKIVWPLFGMQRGGCVRSLGVSLSAGKWWTVIWSWQGRDITVSAGRRNDHSYFENSTTAVPVSSVSAIWCCLKAVINVLLLTGHKTL